MPRTPLAQTARRAAAEFALLTAAGAFMGVLGPYGSSGSPYPSRALYWAILIVGGGVIGIAIDALVRRRVAGFWTRLLLVSVLMTPGVTLLVMGVAHVMYGTDFGSAGLMTLPFQVFVICIAVMALRQLAWREKPAGAADDPSEEDPTVTFRQRLSARRREARLIAVKAEDHYLRVYTDGGEELITARFADALAELAGAPGFRTHRSWWVAAAAIEGVRWRRGAGEARLWGSLTAPVSRGEAAALKRAGWR